tara:strand:+ start:11018 stop:11623 length:606 start_codon:yes stop_codon:yes gene_type:complete
MKTAINIVAFVALFIWSFSSGFFLSVMHTIHNVGFDPPDVNLTQLASKAKPGQWSLVHILGEGCKCSRYVAESLIERGADNESYEHVIFIGHFSEKIVAEVKQKGFHVQQPTDEQVSKMGEFAGTPTLIIFDDQKQVAYQGGYSHTLLSPANPPTDQQIYAQLKHGDTPTNHQIRGCAMSKKHQKNIDRFSLKYNLEENAL